MGTLVFSGNRTVQEERSQQVTLQIHEIYP